LELVLSLKDVFRENPFVEPIVVKKTTKNNNPNKWTKHETNVLYTEPLVRGDNAWVLKECTDDNGTIIKEVTGILNKLSKDNFTTMAANLEKIKIDNKPLVQSVIEIIFQKAINEPHFGEVYATLCQQLGGKQYCNGTINFKREILTQCQKEFEKEKNTHTDNVVAAQLKRKTLGNIKFVGELFIQGMISHTIIFQCTHKLVSNINIGDDQKNENIECICKLFVTVGKVLDVEPYKPKLEQYFSFMKGVSEDKANDFRSRFMIKDVLDLRKNNWIPRRPKESPKKKIFSVNK